MNYLNRIEKAKRTLASLAKPINNLEMKYQNMNAEQAWDLFFSLIVIRFKHGYHFSVNADIDTKPIQWKTLSDIYNFLDDMVIKLSQTVKEYKFLMDKYGTEEYVECFKKYYNDVNSKINEMKVGSQTCKQMALRYKIIQHILYQKYEVYLNEISKLTPERLFEDYFFKGLMPLDTFDKECVDKEGDPINYVSCIT